MKEPKSDFVDCLLDSTGGAAIIPSTSFATKTLRQVLLYLNSTCCEFRESELDLDMTDVSLYCLTSTGRRLRMKFL